MKSHFLIGVLLVLVVASCGCTRFAVCVQHIPRKFYCRADLPPGSRAELVRSERKKLHGFNLMLWELSKPDVHGYFRDLKLAEDEYITNLSIVSTSASFLLFVYLFTVPVTQIEYDVMRIRSEYQTEAVSPTYALSRGDGR